VGWLSFQGKIPHCKLLLMVIPYFNIEGIAIPEFKDYAELVVDPDA
jgi:hypothetical protein